MRGKVSYLREKNLCGNNMILCFWQKGKYRWNVVFYWSGLWCGWEGIQQRWLGSAIGLDSSGTKREKFTLWWLLCDRNVPVCKQLLLSHPTKKCLRWNEKPTRWYLLFVTEPVLLLPVKTTSGLNLTRAFAQQSVIRKINLWFDLLQNTSCFLLHCSFSKKVVCWFLKAFITMMTFGLLMTSMINESNHWGDENI